MWKCFKVLDIFQFFLEFPFWRLGVVPAIFIKGRLGLFGVVKNNTGKYHGGCFQTTNNHMWKKQHTNQKRDRRRVDMSLRNLQYTFKQ